MFTKVLVAEDLDGFNIAVSEALKTLEITNIDHSPWCDEALLKMKKALEPEAPFELLISDLSFTPGYTAAKLTSGQELIAAARALQPSIKVLVYSVEERPHPLQYLFNELDVDGYVLKGRNNIPELAKAIRLLAKGERYVSPQIAHLLKDKSLLEIDEYDRKLMKMLADGLRQENLVKAFRAAGISPSSKSSIEKRINKLKTNLGANTTVQLLLIAKDLGLV